MFSTWLHNNGFKLLVLIIVSIFVTIFYLNHKEDIIKWLHIKPPVIAAQDNKPIIIMPNGQTSNNGSGSGAPIYVTVQPQNTSTTGVMVKPKDPKDPTAPDVKLQENDKYVFEYNSKKYEILPVVKEDYKFQKNGMEITKNSSYTIKVETEKPRFAAGIGYSATQNTTVGLLEIRLDKKGYTSLWAVGGNNVAIGGIKFNF